MFRFTSGLLFFLRMNIEMSVYVYMYIHIRITKRSPDVFGLVPKEHKKMYNNDPSSLF